MHEKSRSYIPRYMIMMSTGTKFRNDNIHDRPNRLGLISSLLRDQWKSTENIENSHFHSEDVHISLPRRH